MSDAVQDHSEKRHRGAFLRIRDLPAWTGAVGTLVAVIAAVIAYEQVHVANVQNESAKRDALVTLVSDIAQVTVKLATAPPSAAAYLNEQRSADAAQGLAIVNALHNDGVPAIDNYELGVAFQGIGGEDVYALTSYERAASGGDPHYRGSALRAIAGIYYQLGGATHIRQAQVAIREAAHAYDGKPDVPLAQRDNNQALTLLYDVTHSAGLHCKQARIEFMQAKSITAADPASVEASLKSYLDGRAEDALIKHCGAA